MFFRKEQLKYKNNFKNKMMAPIKKKQRMDAEEVYRLLKNKLAALEYKPGQSLTEQEIASELNVSRTPVRHALSRLERDGLVEIIPRKGAFIKFLSLMDILEIFQIRRALEGLAARLAAGRINLKGLEEFETTYVDVLQENSVDKLQEIADVGVKLHDYIIKSADNKRIAKILGDYKIQLEICRIFFLNQPRNVEAPRATESIKEHLAIIDALKAGDGEQAERAMREHLINAEKYMLSFPGINNRDVV